MKKTTDKIGNRLKAYSVQTDDAGCIIFESNSASARRNGAGELGCDWEEIETCRRVAWADIYADVRKVPPLEMIAHGWWFECSHCGTRVSDDSADYDDDDNEIPHVPVAEGQAVYCSQNCLDAEHKDRAEREATIQAVKDAANSTFQNIEILHVGEVRPPRETESRWQVTFKFPGGSGTAQWFAGDDLVSTNRSDQDAWEVYRGRAPAKATA